MPAKQADTGLQGEHPTFYQIIDLSFLHAEIFRYLSHAHSAIGEIVEYGPDFFIKKILLSKTLRTGGAFTYLLSERLSTKSALD
jgi:hypothetical protein